MPDVLRRKTRENTKYIMLDPVGTRRFNDVASLML